MKFYAVRKGITPGIYTDWDSCKANVQGFSCAEYKSFKTRNEAEEYLTAVPEKNMDLHDSLPEKGISLQSTSDQSETTGLKEDSTSFVLSDEEEADRLTKQCGTEAVAYVDGSYTNPGAFSCGVVLFTHGEKKIFAAIYQDEAYAAMRNVAGEIKGAEEAMRYCVDHQIQSLTIFHDYQGIAAWCTRAWEAKKPETRAYREYYDEVTKSCQIFFRKVKGHSGDRYNEEADRLAGSADLIREDAEWF